MIDFHYSLAPNPRKVALFLEEAGLPYRPVPVDTRKGEQHRPAFTALNPNAKVPVIVDGDTVVFDSSAILLYLAEKTGQFLPRPERRGELLSWLMFTASGLGPFTGQCVHFRRYAPEPVSYALDRYDFEAWRHWEIVERHLATRDWMLDERYTLLDMAVWGWARSLPWALGDAVWQRLPRVKRLVDIIDARPAAQRALAMKDLHVFKTEMDAEAARAMFPHNERMHAAAFDRFGGPEVVRDTLLPRPHAAAGEVVVRVAAATVNPTDQLMREGKQAALMTGLQPPFVAGMEFAGVVHEVGAGVEGFTVGQPVMGVVNPRRPAGGAHAQYIAVPAASLVVLPPGTDPVEAATLPMNGLTALMVMEALALPRGATLLVTGAAGAVGGYVLGLARAAGLHVIADAKPEDAELVRQLGAAEVLPRGDAMAAAARAAHPAGVDGLVDGALLGNAAAALVREGGVAVTLRKSNPVTLPGLRTHGIAVTDRVEDAAALRRLVQAMADGVLQPRVAARMPMAEAAQAYRLVEQGGLRGRVVLTF